MEKKTYSPHHDIFLCLTLACLFFWLLRRLVDSVFTRYYVEQIEVPREEGKPIFLPNVPISCICMCASSPSTYHLSHTKNLLNGIYWKQMLLFCYIFCNIFLLISSRCYFKSIFGVKMSGLKENPHFIPIFKIPAIFLIYELDCDE